MAKRLVDSNKIKEDLNSVASKAIPRILLEALLGIIIASVIIFVFRLDSDILLSIIFSVSMGAYFSLVLYEIIYGSYLVISLKIKAKRGLFTVEEDELLGNATRVVPRKFRFRIVPKIKDYHLSGGKVILKNHGEYTVTTSKDDENLAYVAENGKVYVVLVKGFKEPLLVYSHLVYDYVEKI